MTGNGVTWNYTYDSNGMRTGRTNGTTTYSYVYNGGRLSQMTVGSDTLRFAYDASGAPMAVTYNGTPYYYVTNLQGDVIALLNSSGTTVVEYTYDTWGNPLTVTETLAPTLGTLNPLRYRGYVYDTETELYYLQSRYYDPTTCRFINADAYASTGQGILGHNMFAYCLNCPTVYADASGYCTCTTDGNPSRVARQTLCCSCGGSDVHYKEQELRDVTNEVMSVLINEAHSSRLYAGIVTWTLGTNALSFGYICEDFYIKVNHYADWDIKRPESWKRTIGTRFPGDSKVVFKDITLTAHELGDYTYGFLGYAYGIPLGILLGGSYYAAGFPSESNALANEVYDWSFIYWGFTDAEAYFKGE